jgi:hypothetical protein
MTSSPATSSGSPGPPNWAGHPKARAVPAVQTEKASTETANNLIAVRLIAIPPVQAEKTLPPSILTANSASGSLAGPSKSAPLAGS